MTDREILTAVQAAKAQVKAQADEARAAVRSLYASAHESTRAREGTGLPMLSSFALEGIEDALFDESAGFEEAAS